MTAILRFSEVLSIFRSLRDRICRMPAAGGPAEIIRGADDGSYEPFPTKRGLYFASGAGTIRRLCRLESTGSVFCFGFPMFSSVFAISNLGIYFVEHRGPTAWEIRFARFDDATSTVVNIQSQPLGPMAVSPDSRHLLFTILRQWTMDLFRARLMN